MSTQGEILWVDDEIDSLKSQILFLKNKGYEVTALSNGHDALELLKEKSVDVESFKKERRAQHKILFGQRAR